MNYRDYLAASDAASAWTVEERRALASARQDRDEARTAWQQAFAVKGRDKREEGIRASRQAYERANRACGLLEEQLGAARDARKRAAKAAWQAECDARTQERVDRQSARPVRDRVIA